MGASMIPDMDPSPIVQTTGAATTIGASLIWMASIPWITAVFMAPWLVHITAIAALIGAAARLVRRPRRTMRHLPFIVGAAAMAAMWPLWVTAVFGAAGDSGLATAIMRLMGAFLIMASPMIGFRSAAFASWACVAAMVHARRFRVWPASRSTAASADRV